MMDRKNLRYRFDEVEIDIANARVSLRGEVRPLEPKSFRLLVFLLKTRDGHWQGRNHGRRWPYWASLSYSLACALRS